MSFDDQIKIEFLKLPFLPKIIEGQLQPIDKIEIISLLYETQEKFKEFYHQLRKIKLSSKKTNFFGKFEKEEMMELVLAKLLPSELLAFNQEIDILANKPHSSIHPRLDSLAIKKAFKN